MMSLLLAAMPAMAESVGNLRGLVAAPDRDGVAGWDISTDTGMKLRVDLLRRRQGLESGGDGFDFDTLDSGEPAAEGSVDRGGALPQVGDGVAADHRIEVHRLIGEAQRDALVDHVDRAPDRLAAVEQHRGPAQHVDPLGVRER